MPFVAKMEKEKLAIVSPSQFRSSAVKGNGHEIAKRKGEAKKQNHSFRSMNILLVR